MSKSEHPNHPGIWQQILDALRSINHCGERDKLSLRNSAAEMIEDYDDGDGEYMSDGMDSAERLIAAIDDGSFDARKPESVALWTAIAERELVFDYHFARAKSEKRFVTKYGDPV